MTDIDLSRPVRCIPAVLPARTVVVYRCTAGHAVKVLAATYRGLRAVPGVGAISCPQCEQDVKHDENHS